MLFFHSPLKNTKHFCIKSTVVITVLVCNFVLAESKLDKRYSADHKFILSLDQAISLAQQNDPWLQGNKHSEDALHSMSIAANSLDAPKMSIAFANLPTDTFNFGQEAMAQLKVGISQVFPRGNSLAIKQHQLQLQSSQLPFLRQDRQAKVKVTVAKLWFNAYKAQQSIALIEDNRALFEQLADVVQSRYATALGKTRQQDIVRAQLELTLLEDRLNILNQQLQSARQQLSQWISRYFIDQASFAGDSTNSSIFIAGNLPITRLLHPQLYSNEIELTHQTLLSYFSKHPAVLSLGQKIKAAAAGIDLAKQKYKTQWSLNASYGYRSESTMGSERADLFSLGISFDLPFFTDNRQDQQVKAAISTTSSIKTDKWLLLKQLFTAFESSKVELERTLERQQLYQTRLLPQLKQQAEASLNAYRNDDGDFAEVIRARIAVLNAQIDLLGINVAEQLSIIQLNYYFNDGLSSTVDSHHKRNHGTAFNTGKAFIQHSSREMSGEIQ